MLKVAALVRDVCGRLEPQALSLVDVPATFDALVELARLGSGAVLRMAARYEEAGAWKRNGARSPEDDIARKTGSGTTRARRKLSTSKRLRQQPKTDDAVRQGRVSTDQADEVSEGASVAPDAEDALLDIDHNLGCTLTHDTRTEDLSWLCWHCHDIKTRHDLYLVGPIGNKRLVRGTAATGTRPRG